MKPIPVKILEWWFGVLAGLASLLPLPVVYGALLEPGLVFLVPLSRNWRSPPESRLLQDLMLGILEFTHFLTSKTHLTPMDKGEGAFS